MNPGMGQERDEWLMVQVARGRARPMLRFEDDPDTTPPSMQGSSPADTAIATESATIVRQAVEFLPARQRMVVVMRIWNGFSCAEIAGLRCIGTIRINRQIRV